MWCWLSGEARLRSDAAEGVFTSQLDVGDPGRPGGAVTKSGKRKVPVHSESSGDASKRLKVAQDGVVRVPLTVEGMFGAPGNPAAMNDIVDTATAFEFAFWDLSHTSPTNSDVDAVCRPWIDFVRRLVLRLVETDAGFDVPWGVLQACVSSIFRIISSCVGSSSSLHLLDAGSAGVLLLSLPFWQHIDRAFFGSTADDRPLAAALNASAALAAFLGTPDNRQQLSDAVVGRLTEDLRPISWRLFKALCSLPRGPLPFLDSWRVTLLERIHWESAGDDDQTLVWKGLERLCLQGVEIPPTLLEHRYR